MRITTRTNVDQVLGDLDRFVDDAQRKAVPRALNRLAEQAKTAGLRAVADEYRIGPRAFEAYLNVRLARDGDVEASIGARGRGLPLQLFAPRQTRAGVSVMVKGRRFVIPHAFIARMRSGRVGVFARGSYGGKGLTAGTGQSFGRFAFGRRRLPIGELFTFGPSEAWSAERVVGAMSDRVLEQMDKVIRNEMRFAMRGR